MLYAFATRTSQRQTNKQKHAPAERKTMRRTLKGYLEEEDEKAQTNPIRSNESPIAPSIQSLK
jgi:hypothetical protein